MGWLNFMGSKKVKPPTDSGTAKFIASHGDEARRVALVLADDALDALGYFQGDKVAVQIGDVWQGDLGAALLVNGLWRVGFIFWCEGGVRISTSRTDLPPRFFFLDQIVTLGRVVALEGRAVIQAGITLPKDGADRFRFRFRL